MKRRRGPLLPTTATCLVGLALTACGSPNAEPLAVNTTMTSGSATSTTDNGAPPLTQPELDTARFMSNPCGLLTAQQTARVADGAPGRPTNNNLGPTCSWRASSTPAKIDFSVEINTRTGGLNGLYALRGSTLTVFDPTEVAGYPAVIAMPSDERRYGTCRLSTAVSQKVLVVVDLQLSEIGGEPPDYGNPCPRAMTIAEHVLTNLKGGA